MRLLFRPRTVLHAFRHDENLARTQGDVASSHLNDKATFEHEKEVVGVGVFMPCELALDLDDHQVVAVELTDGAWLPMFVKGGQLLLKVDGSHKRHSFAAGGASRNGSDSNEERGSPDIGRNVRRNIRSDGQLAL